MIRKSFGSKNKGSSRLLSSGPLLLLGLLLLLLTFLALLGFTWFRRSGNDGLAKVYDEGGVIYVREGEDEAEGSAGKVEDERERAKRMEIPNEGAFLKRLEVFSRLRSST